MTKIKVLNLFAWDSFFKLGRSLTNNIDQYQVTWGYLSKKKGLTDDEISNYERVNNIKITEFIQIPLPEELNKYDAVILNCPGNIFFDYIKINYLNNPELSAKRPIFIASYAGVIYEQYYKGYLNRYFADIICVNSQTDYNRFYNFAKANRLNSDILTLIGFPILKTVNTSSSADIILFAGQPTVPRKKGERKYIVQKLYELALKYPEKRVILKPRHSLKQTTLHKTVFHYEDIFNNLKKKSNFPANFTINYNPIEETMKDTCLMITVSSTAAIESISNNIPTCIVSDFGVNQEHGSHYFAESGLLASFDDLIGKIDFPELIENWRDQNIPSLQSSRLLYDKIIKLNAIPRAEITNQYISSFYQSKLKNDNNTNCFSFKRMVRESAFGKYVISKLKRLYYSLTD